jgi:hypothetical protein
MESQIGGSGGEPGTKRGRMAGSKGTQFKPGSRHPKVLAKAAGLGKDAHSNQAKQIKCPVPGLLRDMRIVYKTKGHDRERPELTRLREFWGNDPARFLKQMQDLEGEHKKELTAAKALAEGGVKVEELPVGEQETRLIGVIDRLLSGYKS